MLKTYTKNFKKVVHGYLETKAENEEEAQNKFDSGEYDEYENKSDVTMDDEILLY